MKFKNNNESGRGKMEPTSTPINLSLVDKSGSFILRGLCMPFWVWVKLKLKISAISTTPNINDWLSFANEYGLTSRRNQTIRIPLPTCTLANRIDIWRRCAEVIINNHTSSGMAFDARRTCKVITGFDADRYWQLEQ
jgi:hypothetical protein